ncbi:MAG: hypothetical protein K2H23_06665 [Oscillospiraceae bacterium]|nr:hypothetical protein [Oscillospiraceae bacterium]
MFVVLNTASITLIPTTSASLRIKHGSSEPMEILPCVLITSVFALAMGLISAAVLDEIYMHTTSRLKNTSRRYTK